MVRVLGRQVTRLAQYLTETVGLELTRAVMALVTAGLMLVAVLWLWGQDHTILLTGLVERGVSLGLDTAGILAGFGLALYLMLLTAVNMLLIARYHELRANPDPLRRIVAALLVSQVILYGPEDAPTLTHLVDTAPDDVDLDELVEAIHEYDGRPIYAPEWPVVTR